MSEFYSPPSYWKIALWAVIACAIALALLHWQDVKDERARNDWHHFGCQKTVINAAGQDTGECN